MTIDRTNVMVEKTPRPFIQYWYFPRNELTSLHGAVPGVCAMDRVLATISKNTNVRIVPTLNGPAVVATLSGTPSGHLFGVLLSMAKKTSGPKIPKGSSKRCH